MISCNYGVGDVGEVLEACDYERVIIFRCTKHYIYKSHNHMTQNINYGCYFFNYFKKKQN